MVWGEKLSRGDYIRNKENIIAIGDTGTSTTHIAISLGLIACQLREMEGKIGVERFLKGIEDELREGR